MPAIKQQIEHWQGDTHIIAIPIKDGQGLPVDLTDASGDWWMAKSASAVDADVYVKKSSAVPGEIAFEGPDIDGIWTMKIKLVPADTVNVRAGTWYHEARVIDAVGNTGRVSLGPFLLQPSTIRP